MVMAHDVFLSYASRDKATADAACAILESTGVRCWIAPRDITAGIPWSEGIIEGIMNSRAMVLIFSQSSNNSDQVKREVERAVSRGIPIIPLRIENAKLSKSMEYYISSVHWLDACTPPLERHLRTLAETVKQILGGQVPEGKTGPRNLPVGLIDRKHVVIGTSVGIATVGVFLALIFLNSGRAGHEAPRNGTIPPSPAAKPVEQASPYGEYASYVAASSDKDALTVARNKMILEKLEEPISMSFQEETPLEDVLKYIKQATTTQTYAGIPIQIDPVGFQEAERSLASVVTLDMEGTSLRTTLKLILNRIDLGYRIWNGLLVITSEPISENSPYK
jgi:TIR domain